MPQHENLGVPAGKGGPGEKTASGGSDLIAQIRSYGQANATHYPNAVDGKITDQQYSFAMWLAYDRGRQMSPEVLAEFTVPEDHKSRPTRTKQRPSNLPGRSRIERLSDFPERTPVVRGRRNRNLSLGDLSITEPVCSFDRHTEPKVTLGQRGRRGKTR